MRIRAANQHRECYENDKKINRDQNRSNDNERLAMKICRAQEMLNNKAACDNQDDTDVITTARVMIPGRRPYDPTSSIPFMLVVAKPPDPKNLKRNYDLERKPLIPKP